jgi:hypothetical protein
MRRLRTDSASINSGHKSVKMRKLHNGVGLRQLNAVVGQKTSLRRK